MPTIPPLLTAYQTYEQDLAWLERLRALLDDTNGWTVETQAAIGTLTRALLLAAAGHIADTVLIPRRCSPGSCGTCSARPRPPSRREKNAMDPTIIVMLVHLAVELLPFLIQALEYLVPLMVEVFEALNPSEQTQLRQAWAIVWGL
jgi:hypothetical protein